MFTQWCQKHNNLSTAGQTLQVLVSLQSYKRQHEQTASIFVTLSLGPAHFGGGGEYNTKGYYKEIFLYAPCINNIFLFCVYLHNYSSLFTFYKDIFALLAEFFD